MYGKQIYLQFRNGIMETLFVVLYAEVAHRNQSKKYLGIITLITKVAI